MCLTLSSSLFPPSRIHLIICARLSQSDIGAPNGRKISCNRLNLCQLILLYTSRWRLILRTYVFQVTMLALDFVPEAKYPLLVVMPTSSSALPPAINLFSIGRVRSHAPSRPTPPSLSLSLSLLSSPSLGQIPRSFNARERGRGSFINIFNTAAAAAAIKWFLRQLLGWCWWWWWKQWSR